MRCGTDKHHDSTKVSFAFPLEKTPADQARPLISFSVLKVGTRIPLGDVTQKVRGKKVVDAKSIVLGSVEKENLEKQLATPGIIVTAPKQTAAEVAKQSSTEAVEQCLDQATGCAVDGVSEETLERSLYSGIGHFINQASEENVEQHLGPAMEDSGEEYSGEDDEQIADQEMDYAVNQVPDEHFEQIPEHGLSEKPGEDIDLPNEQSSEETMSFTRKTSHKTRSQKRSARRRKRRERLEQERLEILSIQAPSQTMNNDKPAVLSKSSKPSSRQRRSRRKRLERLGQTPNQDIEIKTSKDTPLETPTDPVATRPRALSQSNVRVELETEGQRMTLTAMRKLKKQRNIDNLNPEHNEMIARLRQKPEDPEAKKYYQDVLGYKNSTYQSGQGALKLNENGKRTAQQIEEHERNLKETKRRKLEKIQSINEDFEERLASLGKKVAEIDDMLGRWKVHSLARIVTESNKADTTLERNIGSGGKFAGRGILAVI